MLEFSGALLIIRPGRPGGRVAATEWPAAWIPVVLRSQCSGEGCIWEPRSPSLANQPQPTAAPSLAVRPARPPPLPRAESRFGHGLAKVGRARKHILQHG